MLSKLPFRLVLVFDDCQWQDRYSWAITVALKSIQVILISRPAREYNDPSMREQYEAILKSQDTCHIKLGQVSLPEIRRIVAALKFTHVEELSERLYELSLGNAFALDVLLKHLREQRKKVADSLADSVQLLIDTRSVFVAQLDSLETRFQRLVRTAALIGQVFYLTDIIALNADLGLSYENTVDLIHKSDKYGFLEPLSDGKRWRFRHCLICIQIANIMTNYEHLKQQGQLAMYFETQLMKRGINQDSSRKPELLPLLFALYSAIHDEEKQFNIAFKLIKMYYKLEMRFECRKMIYVVINDKERFRQLYKNRHEKLCRIGLDLSRSLSDPDLCRQFLSPCAFAFTGLKLNQCSLLALAQLIANIVKMDRFWKQKNITFVEDDRDIETKERYNTFWQLTTEFVDAPHELLLTLNQWICNTHLVMTNIKYGPNTVQWTETMLLSCLLLLSFGKHESGDKILDILGFERAESDSLIMKMINKFSDMSEQETMQMPFTFRALVRLLYFVMNFYRANYERSHRVAQAVWKVAMKHNTTYMMDSAMYLSTADILYRFNGYNSSNDVLVDFIHKKRLYIAQHPSSMTAGFALRTALSTYIRKTVELVDGEDFIIPLPSGVVLDRDDYNFALNYLQKFEEKNEDNSYYRISTGATLSIVHFTRGQYDDALVGLQTAVDGLAKVQGPASNVLYGVSSFIMLRHFCMWLYLLCCADKVPTVLQQSRAESLFLKYMSKMYKATRKRSSWKSLNILPSTHYVAAFFLELHKLHFKKSLQLMELAKIEFQKIHLNDSLEIMEILLMLCKAEVPPFCKQFVPKSPPPVDCIRHYETAIEFCNKGNSYWTARHLKRIANAIGIQTDA